MLFTRNKLITIVASGLVTAMGMTLGAGANLAFAATPSTGFVAANSTKLATTLQTGRSLGERSALTKQAVTDCIQQLATAPHPHPLTPAEAQACAPGVPMFSKNNLPETDPGAIFIVTSSSDRAMINFHTSGSASHLNTAAFQLTSAGFSKDWKWDKASFTETIFWGSISGYGYGNHCGYSDFPNSPSVQVSNATGGWDDTRGHYDSNYGKNNFGENYAAEWSNINVHTAWATDTIQCRIWINPDATIWHTCY